MIKLTYIGKIGWEKQYICHFTDLLTKEENSFDIFISDRYNLAKLRAESLGGVHYDDWGCQYYVPYLNCGNFLFTDIENIDLKKLLHIKQNDENRKR